MYLCYDLGGTALKAGIVHSSGVIQKKKVVLTRVKSGFEGILEQFKCLEKELINETGVSKENIIGLAVGVPGFVNSKGLVVKAPNLGWKNIDIIELLQENFDYPVCVCNDANAATLGEAWLGAGREQKNLLCLTIGTGIGAGVIINQRLCTGEVGFAGEIGHFIVKAKGGRLCACGKRGCLETESSGSAMVYYAQKALKEGQRTSMREILRMPRKINSSDVVQATINGDIVASEIIENAANFLGQALANIYLVFEPQRVIIGGGVARAGNVLLDPIIKWFNYHSLPYINGEELILPAKLGNDAGMIGLAKYMKDLGK